MKNNPSAFKSRGKAVSNTKLLTRQQEATLAIAIANGDDDAKNQLISANLCLVIKIIRDEFLDKGLPFEELTSAGNMALTRVAKKFDPTKGAKFSSYAAWYIKGDIRRAIARHSKTVRVPVSQHYTATKLLAVEKRLSGGLGRQPTIEELAQETKLSPQAIYRIRDRDVRIVSLSDCSPQDERCLEEKIADQFFPSPDQNIMCSECAQLDTKLLETLTPEEQKIIDLSFGLSGDQPLSLRKLKTHFNLSHEKIRQIKDTAIIKMRTSLREIVGHDPVPSDFLSA